MWKSGLLLFAIGCGSSSSASTTVEPTAVDVTIDGTHYHAAQAISSPAPSLQTGKVETGVVILSSATDACAAPDAQVQHPGETTIVILLQAGDGPPTGPGAYTVVDLTGPTPSPPPTRVAVLYATVLDAACGNDGDTGASAVSGTVTITAVDNGAYAGSFDVALDSGDHVKGTFDADLCDQIPGELASTTPPTCKP